MTGSRMMNKRKIKQKRKLEQQTLAVLKEKYAELILLREEINTRERFAEALAEKKALVQQLIEVNHQIQAVKQVIGLFAGGDE